MSALLDAPASMARAARLRGSRRAAAGEGTAEPELLARLDLMSAVELDDLDRAVVRLDDAGVVLAANRAARTLLADDGEIVGRSLFTQVAPCTNNPLFRGAFDRGVAERGMNLVFFYTFTYPMAPRSATVHLHRTPAGTNWLLAA